MEQQDKKCILQVKNLHVHYITEEEEVYAVNGISFDLNEGDSIGLVGETGAGKTTTAMAIMQLIPDPPGVITDGEIYFKGSNMITNTDKENQKIRGNGISMIFQDPMTALNPTMTVGDQLVEVLRRHNKGMSKDEAKKRCIEMLEMVGVKAERFDDYPHQFSGGMKQRVVIAMALVCNPDLLIADEPTTALDVTIQAQVLDLMQKLKEQYQTSMLMITHDLGIVAEVCDEVSIMYAGQIVEYGKVDEIFYDAWHPYTWALLSALPQLGIKGEELPTIEGTPPNLFNEIKGDAFAPRNRMALAIDFEEEPPFFDVSPTHKAKTWYLDPRAPKIEQPNSIRKLREKMKGRG